MQEVKVGVIGFGTVGRGTAQVLYEQADRLQRRGGGNVFIKTIADIGVESLPAHLEGITLTRNADDILVDPEIDIVVELIGGTTAARTFILKAIENGKHVVTANKALLSQHGTEIFAAASEKKVEVGFEASVGGGIPIIKALKEGLVANRIDSIIGILNGTGNYILSRMSDHGFPFQEALQEAQDKGYAEADPTYDIEGIDTAHKLVILMSMAYGMKMDLADVTCEGISRLQPVDIEYAREMGYRLKLLAISRNHGDHVEARVHPTLVHKEHMMASINGTYNGVCFSGDMVEDVLLYGHGAGMMATGSAVAADIIDISRNIMAGAVNRVPVLSYLPEYIEKRRITPMADLRCPYYIRFSTLDKTKVLSRIAGVLGDNGISIESVLQKASDTEDAVPIVMCTYEASEDAVNKALAEIDSLDITTEEAVKIRILVEDHEQA
ncbi:MAG: homoserine dehydrogenase [Desulfurivibrionaceae bacterium]